MAVSKGSFLGLSSKYTNPSRGEETKSDSDRSRYLERLKSHLVSGMSTILAHSAPILLSGATVSAFMVHQAVSNASTDISDFWKDPSPRIRKHEIETAREKGVAHSETVRNLEQKYWPLSTSVRTDLDGFWNTGEVIDEYNKQWGMKGPIFVPGHVRERRLERQRLSVMIQAFADGMWEAIDTEDELQRRLWGPWTGPPL